MGIGIDAVEISTIGRRNGVTKLKSSKPIVDGDPGDAFDHAITLLAGDAYERSLGRRPTGGTGDLTKAAVLLEMQASMRRDVAAKALAIVQEVTEQLVGSERFQVLAASLAPHLDGSRWNWHYGPEIERFLRENDPESSTTTERRARGGRQRLGLLERQGGGRLSDLRVARHAAWPPTANVSRHMHDDGTVTVYSFGKLIAAHVSSQEAERLSAEILA